MPTRMPLALALIVVAAAFFASVSPGGPPAGPPVGFERAMAVKERNAVRLLNTPGVVGVGVGANRAGRAVIHVYTERPDTQGLPSVLEGVGVERVATGVIEARAPTDRFARPVPIGVSAGLKDVATGTLGVRVTNGTNVYALSNNHVFAGINTANIGDSIVQPGPSDGGTDPADRIGTLAAYQSINFNAGSTNTMDAAIALTSTANVGIATPADGYGAPSTVTTTAFVGQAVQKYGRTTGLQLGTVADLNVSVDVCYLLLLNVCLEEARFINQISVSPGTFSAPGDSGSLIVTQAGNQPVALLFAGGDGLTIGTPIDIVLQRFGVTIDGQPPVDSPPAAPTSLGALAGDGSVSLAWTAPSFDGGSPIANYKIYRGTAPGSESFLANAGTSTGYVDGSVVNGQTYYYKVSAENANGEGPPSNETVATPSDLVAPVEPLPTVDDFNRANENPLSDAGRWTNGINGSAESGLYVTSNSLACSKTTTCTAWRNSAQYGPDVEVWGRVSALPGAGNPFRLLARVQQPGTSTYDGYMLRPNQLAGTDQVLFERVDNGSFVSLLTVTQEFAAGDVFMLRVKGSTMEGWRYDGSVWSRLGTVSDSTYPGPGWTGVGIRGTTGRVDDFGARTMGAPPPDQPPGPPGALSAAASSASQVDLFWGAASDDVGVVRYRVERCQGGGCSSFAEVATSTTTNYSDTGLSPSTSYSYRVRAEDAVANLGPYSNVASATTQASSDPVAPVEPLPILDNFDRPNERPLSPQRWGDGVLGSGERSLKVVSNQLASDRTTTTTAWWKTPQFGADSETWATMATLPGNGNVFRLYVRLQTPGSSAVDGYMLMYTQASGTDSVAIYRLTNGTATSLGSVGREIGPGARLLLRAKDTALEAWVQEGSTWTRVVRVVDSTYSGAGYVGVGIRGKTGRLDDFGAR